MLFSLLIFIIFTYFIIELSHKLRINSPLILKPIKFKNTSLDSKQKYIALVEIINTDQRMEVMIPFFKVFPNLIGVSKDELLSIQTKIQPQHPDLEDKNIDYWSAYVLKSKKSTFIKIEIEYELKINAKNNLKCLWLDIEWGHYGPFGFFTKYDGFALSNYLNLPKEKTPNTLLIEPIKTHILGSLDDPITVLKSYLPRDCSPSDILTIGESPLAIMQGRYIDYRDINISPTARFLCRVFHPTSSLATACGMQTLINISGPTRVMFSWLIGGICKSFGLKGVFYRLAGEQARLIDDITGTTPPYDKSLVLGPKDAKSFCIHASKVLKVNVAVVDVNDLGRVKILSTNDINNNALIQKSLTSNPAGNANQHTPIVLIRKNEIRTSSRDS